MVQLGTLPSTTFNASSKLLVLNNQGQESEFTFSVTSVCVLKQLNAPDLLANYISANGRDDGEV